MLVNSHFRKSTIFGIRRKDTSNSLTKLGEGLEAILLHIQDTPKMGAYATTTVTATKTSLKKRILAASNFNALTISFSASNFSKLFFLGLNS